MRRVRSRRAIRKLDDIGEVAAEGEVHVVRRDWAIGGAADDGLLLIELAGRADKAARIGDRGKVIVVIGENLERVAAV